MDTCKEVTTKAAVGASGLLSGFGIFYAAKWLGRYVKTPITTISESGVVTTTTCVRIWSHLRCEKFREDLRKA